MTGLFFQGLSEIGSGLFAFLQPKVRQAAVVISPREFRLQGDARAVTGDGRFVLCQAVVAHSPHEPGPEAGRVLSRGFLKEIERLVKLSASMVFRGQQVLIEGGSRRLERTNRAPFARLLRRVD